MRCSEAEEYIKINYTAEKGEVLTDDHILETVTASDTPEHTDSESDDETAATRVIVTKMAETALDDVITFFEANPSRADKHLTQFEEIMPDY